MKYTSLFAPYIIGLIEEKRSLGYKYDSQPNILRRFDSFCSERYPDEDILSREIVLDWAAKRPGEHPGTLQQRITPVKELAKYMIRLGQEAFILPKGFTPRIPRYIPHIYSNYELKRIFTQTDQCRFCQLMLVSLTADEAKELCDLCIRDIRLKHPAIVTLTGKGRKTRHVLLFGNTVELLRLYMREHKLFFNANPNAPFFLTKDTQNLLAAVSVISFKNMPHWLQKNVRICRIRLRHT